MSEFISVSPCKELPKIPQETAHEYCIAQAELFSKSGVNNGNFLIDGLTDQAVSYKDVEEKSRRIASYFYKRGLCKGDIVTYLTNHQIHIVPLMIGVWRANGVTRSLYVDEAAETILEKLQESNCKWIFCDVENAENLQKIGQKCGWPVEVVVVGGKLDGFGNMDDLYADNGDQCPKTEVTEDDMAMIVPTSGTTGPSKGAVHTHKTVIYHIRTWGMMPYSFDKTNIIASKATHISGAILPLSTLTRGVQAIVLPKVSKEILIETVDKYKPGLAFAFPSFLLALGSLEAKKFDMSSVETILTGGSPVTSEIRKAYYAMCNVKDVIVCYGLTEGASFSTNADFRNNGYSYKDCDSDSVGKPYPGGQFQVRDLDTMEPVGPNVKGEVCGRGPFMFKEYFKNPKATKDTFVDGWFKTGDVGYLETNGYLHVVDRAKDIFKYFHNHISPTELEAVISKHPEVKEACVVPVPDEGGEVPRAFVVLKNPNGHDKQKISEEILKFANDALASYKQIRGGVYIAEDLPKGKTGKVTRSLVSAMELPKY